MSQLSPCSCGSASIGAPHHKNEDRLVSCQRTLKGQLCSLWAIVDGHGGSFPSSFISKHLEAEFFASLERVDGNLENALVEALSVLDQRLLKLQFKEDLKKGGAVVCAAALMDNRLAVANVGDCRAVLKTDMDICPCSTGKLVEENVDSLVLQLSEIHRVSTPLEKRRVLLAGAKILDGRVAGVLIPSRVLGDLDVREESAESRRAIISTPEVRFATFRAKPAHLSCRTFLILASDGIWDTMSSAEASHIVSDVLEYTSGGAQIAAESLVGKARDMDDDEDGFHDDCSALVVELSFAKAKLPLFAKPTKKRGAGRKKVVIRRRRSS